MALSGTGTAAIPQLTLSAPTLSFGSLTDGTSKALSLTLTSSGTATVSITSLAVSGTGYSIAATTLPKVLAPGQTLVVPVTFAPTTAGALTGKLTVVSTSTTSPTSTVALSGTGRAAIPQLTLSAPTLSFGSLTDGTSKALSLTLTSSGTANVSITSLAVSGTGYSIAATTLPKVLAPGQTLVVPVTFAPTTAGALTGKLTVVSTSTTSPTSTVALSGTGTATTPQLTLSATTLSFGSLTDGTSKALSLTLTSSGTANVSITSLAVSGTGYSIAATTLPKVLAPGQTLVVPVTFAPTTAGALTGKLTVVSTSTTSPTSTVALSGTGTATTPQLTLSATTLSFGSLTDGTSKALSVTLTSSGTANVSITSLAVSGTGYSIAATTLPKVLAPGQTLVVPVTFAPTTAGALTGKLTVVSTSTTSPTSTVALSGTGTATTPQLTLSATTLSFGSLTDGTSKAMTVTLTSSGTAALALNSATVSGTGFSMVATPMPMTLAVGQSVTLQITFAPQTAATDSGKLTISSNSSTGATSTVSLTGTGTAAPNPVLSLNATTLSFGTVTVGSPETQAVTLSSTGTTAITVSSATVTGTGFSIVGGTFPLTLNPGSTVTITVQFDPTAAGAITGRMTISSNSTSGATSTVALTGTGEAQVAHSVSLTWTAPTSSADPVAGYNVYRSASGSTTFTLLTTSVDTQTTYVDSTVTSGTMYTYEVKSVDKTGVDSVASNEFTVTIP